MKRQLLSKRWFVSLLLTLMSTISWAYDLEIDGMYYNLNSDEVSVSLTYKSMTEFVYTGDVVIPSSVKYRGRNYKVTAIGDDAFAGCEELTSVSIPDEVETIGSYAFAGCEGLTSVTIPSGVKTIKAYAFNICENLSSIVIPQNVQTIEKNAFSDCSGLTSVTINSDTFLSKSYSESNNLKNIFGEQVKEYIIGDNVTSIGSNAFRNCSGLTSVTIGNSVSSIGSGAFDGCSGLTSVTINSNAILSKTYSTSNNLRNIFGEQVKEYIIGESVTSIGFRAFSGCSSLTSITVASGNTKYDSRNDCNAIIETSSNTLVSGCKKTVIPNTVTSIGNYAFDGCSSLTSITIPESVKSIGVDAFNGCSGLTSVTIPNSVKSISGYAFEGCSGLTSVIIPNSVTSIGNRAFYGCSGLTSVIINSNAILSETYSKSNNLRNIFGEQVKEYIIGESVTSIGERAFDGCSGLTSVTIGNSVTSIGFAAFSGCSGLTSVNIPNSVTSIGAAAFYNCSGLTSVTIGNSVKSIGNDAFNGCSGLTSVTIPNSVKSIGDDAFNGCSGLTSVTIGNGVTSIGSYAFRDCSGLTSVTIPNSVKSIGYGTFWNCYGLTSVTIGNSVTSIGNGAFDGCSGLTSITIPNSVTSIGSGAFDGCSGLTSINVASGNTKYDSRDNCNAIIETATNTLLIGCKASIIPESVTSIGDDAFSVCSSLTSITIPNSVTSIGYRAFYGCSGLTSVTIGNSVTSIGYRAFDGCSGLTSVTINSNAILSKSYSESNNLKNIFGEQVKEYNIGNGVTSIGNYAFEGCSGLTSVSIPESVRSIGEYAYSGCSALTSVTIKSNVILSDTYSESNNLKNIFGEQVKEYIIGDNVTSIGWSAFEGCSGLTSVTIGNSVTSIGWNAFRDCSGLKRAEFTSIESLCKILFNGGESNPISYAKHLYINGEEVKDVMIPNNVSSLNYTFCGCSALTSVTIPDGVTSIGDCTFSWCSGLTSINIPNSVTSIGNSAFWDCSGLTSITIPESVTSIDYSAFAYCSGLTSVTIPESVTNIDLYVFAGCTNLINITVADGNMKYDSRNNCNAIIGTSSNTLVSGCKNTVIPNSVTRIGISAFQDCSGLTTINIPESVTSIGDDAFANCSGLTSVTCLAENVPTTGGGVFYNVPQSTATLYVPETSLNAYKTADQWKEFGNIVGIDPTAVEELKSNKNLKANESAPIFDLMGRHLQQKPASGYYIQGGKTFFVK